jgi:hypothetical protein
MTAHGCAASGATGHLPRPEWTTILTAGRAAEQLFNCRAHHGTWLRDYGEIDSRLDREGLAHERERRIDDAEAHARAILSRDYDAAFRVFKWLAKHGSIERKAFERLVRGDASQRQSRRGR